MNSVTTAEVAGGTPAAPMPRLDRELLRPVAEALAARSAALMAPPESPADARRRAIRKAIDGLSADYRAAALRIVALAERYPQLASSGRPVPPPCLDGAVVRTDSCLYGLVRGGSPGRPYFHFTDGSAGQHALAIATRPATAGEALDFLASLLCAD